MLKTCPQMFAKQQSGKPAQKKYREGNPPAPTKNFSDRRRGLMLGAINQFI